MKEEGKSPSKSNSSVSLFIVIDKIPPGITPFLVN
jgi:hypothetical protein